MAMHFIITQGECSTVEEFPTPFSPRLLVLFWHSYLSSVAAPHPLSAALSQQESIAPSHSAVFKLEKANVCILAMQIIYLSGLGSVVRVGH